MVEGSRRVVHYENKRRKQTTKQFQTMPEALDRSKPITKMMMISRALQPTTAWPIIIELGIMIESNIMINARFFCSIQLPEQLPSNHVAHQLCKLRVRRGRLVTTTGSGSMRQGQVEGDCAAGARREDRWL